MFIIKNNNIVPDPKYLTIPEFKVIWDRDRTEGKSRALDELKFVYHLCDVNSPYVKRARGKELYSMVAKDFILKYSDFDETDVSLKEAILKYKEMQDTISMRDYKAIQRGMEHIQTMCNTFSIPDTLDQITKLELGEKYLKLVASYEKSVEALTNIYKKICEQISEAKASENAVTSTKASGRELRRHSNRTNDVSADSATE